MKERQDAEPFYALATDGWKRKFCGGGIPLINVCSLLPGGGSCFLKIVTAAGVIKSGEWTFNLHKDLITELEPDDPTRILGLVLDNAPSNKCGMDKLESEFPHLIIIGCQAHSLNLLIKDLIGGIKESCPWSAKVRNMPVLFKPQPTATASNAYAVVVCYRCTVRR